MKRATLLKAHWRYLSVLNFEIEARLLLPFIPKGVELDLFRGRTLISLVGFEFAGAELLGVPVPFHQLFPEMNLRCYVKRDVEGEMRRGVLFLKEIVPCRAVVFVANRIFNESFSLGKMTHTVRWGERSKEVRYTVELGGWRASLDVRSTDQASNDPQLAFVLDRNLAYNVSRSGITWEYQVDRLAWHAFPATSFELQLDAELIYGATLGAALRHAPCSAALVDGSAVRVHRGMAIEPKRAQIGQSTINAAMS